MEEPEELEDAGPGLAVLSGLTRANARVADALRALATRPRTDLTGLAPSAAAMLLARASRQQDRPLLVVTADVESARRTAADLAFFLGGEDPTEGADGVSDRGPAPI